MRDYLICLFVVAIAASYCTGCSRAGDARRQAIARVFVPPTAPYQERSTAEREALRSAFGSLRRGDSPAKVLSIVGPPNAFMIGAPKELDRPPTCSFWDYQLSNPVSQPLNAKADKYVTLTFNSDNVLMAVHSTVDGVGSWRADRVGNDDGMLSLRGDAFRRQISDVLEPQKRSYDAYFTWEGYAPGSDPAKASYIFNGVAMGIGANGIENVAREIRKLQAGARVLEFPAYHWTRLGSGRQPPYTQYGEPLYAAIKEKEIVVLRSDYDQNGRYLGE